MILLTGSTGTIGSELIKHYPNKFLTKDISTNLTLRNGFNLKFNKEDNIKSAILLGGISNFKLIRDNPELAIDVNVNKLKISINNLIDQGIHITFISSESVFSGSKGNYKELEKANPIFLYGFMKYLIEEHLKSLKADNKWAIVRLAKVYNPNPLFKSLFSDVIESLGKKLPYPIFSDIYTNPIDINVVTKIIYEISHQNFSGIYHIGGKDSVSRKDIIEKINLFLSKKGFEKLLIDASYTKSNSHPFYKYVPKNTSLNCDYTFKKLDVIAPSIINQILSYIKSNYFQN